MQAKQDRCLGQLLLWCQSAWGHIFMQGSTRPTHSATLLCTRCNWKIVSNVNNELGMAVVVCIYVCLQYLNTVSILCITTGLQVFRVQGRWRPTSFFNSKYLFLCLTVYYGHPLKSSMQMHQSKPVCMMMVTGNLRECQLTTIFKATGSGDIYSAD